VFDTHDKFCLIISRNFYVLMMEASGFFDHVLFVIVLYKKKLSDCQAYRSLASLNAADNLSILVYDNSPEPIETAEPAITYYHDAKNRGVSAAYNYAAKIANESRKPWMLFLDQDTHLPPATLEAYPVAVSVFSKEVVFTPVIKDNGTIVSPYKMIGGKGKPVDRISEGVHTLGKYYIINSAMLVSLRAFQASGGYDEQFPLDFSDVVFCDKLRKNHPGFVVIHGEGHHQLAANDPTKTFQQSFTRFNIYCKAIRLYKKLYAPQLNITIPVFSRGLRLFLRYGNTAFLNTAWKSITGKE